MSRLMCSIIGLIVVLEAGVAHGADETFDAKGFHPQRQFFSQLPFEHIDPLTGNVLLTFTDLVLPGNAGFDLRIQRTYNSKIYANYATTGETLGEDSWAGVGWSLHMGRVFRASSAYSGNPIIEMPDGSQQQAYPHISAPSGCSSCFITREYWLYNRNTKTLSLPNGVRYTFGHEPVGQTAAYATRIEDPFGNVITITYAVGAGASAETINSITQTVGFDTRVITFNHSTGALGNLTTMTFQGRVWTYTHATTAHFGYSLLTSVQPPVGPAWVFTYNTTTLPRYELTRVTTPHGGWVHYTYNDQLFNLGTTYEVRTRSMTQRTTGGRAPAGTWAYAYAQGTSKNQTTISTPCNSVRYTFLGVGMYSTQGAVWRIGLPSSLVTTSGGTTLQTETNSWAASLRISTQTQNVGFNVDAGVFVPLLTARAIARGGVTLSTNHSYSSSNFNDYGRPFQSVESGQLSRTTTRTFQYGFSLYIIDKVQSETVAVSGESFTKSSTHRSSDGFLSSQTVYGVGTTFNSDADGNVASRTNARGFTTYLTHRYGQWTSMDTPQYTITRSINPSGTVASETRRGFTTAFTYDALARLTLVDPPAGNNITTSYDNSGGTFARVTRGASQTTSNLDGFGRVSSTDNTVGVSTDYTFDSCGRRTYSSYPFTSSNIGTTISYDGLWRVTRQTHPDGQFVAYSYSGMDVTITDENGRATLNTRRAFGDPDDLRLTAVRDAATVVTSYTYNALGNLTSVTRPGTAARTWTYNTKNQLISETHPESGTTSFTRDAVGNMSGRTDAKSQSSTYVYDGNDRLTSINHVGSLHDVSLAYDASDNRTSASNGSVTSSFAYDAANRLSSRSDATGGQTFSTSYTYDGNNNVLTMDYPSGRTVVYAYDSEGRITSVSDGAGTTYANTFSYHPSGAVTSYRAGNTLVHSQSFDSRYRTNTLNAGGVLQLDYSYDNTGNVTGITDTRAGMNQTFGYDSLDRLTSASGWNPAGFTYESTGNRLSRTGLNPTSYNYSAATNRLLSATGSQAETFSYDSNGNMTADAAAAYAHTPENLLESATTAGVTTTYRYDADNVRKLKLTAGATHFYVHGSGSQLLSEYQQACSVLLPVRDYVYVGSRLLASVRFPGSSSFVSLVAASSGRIETGPASSIGVRATTGSGGPLPCGLSVQYNTTAITATDGSDYTGVSGSLVFPAGTPSGTVQNVAVNVLSDMLDEPDETFSFVLTGVSGANLISPAVHTVTILDDDEPPIVPNITIDDVVMTEGNTPGSMVFTARLSAATTAVVTVDYATADISAIAGPDYTAKSGTVTFTAGDVSEPINVAIVGDSHVESLETFAVNLSGAAGGVVTDSQGIGTILSDDVFAQDPLQAGVTTVNAVHVNELRSNINYLRSAYGLSPVGWTDASLIPGTTVVQAIHVTEMRAALAPVFPLAGMTAPTYVDPTISPGMTILAIHIQQLRDAVRSIP